MSERVLVVRVGRWHVAGGGVEVVGPAAALAHVPLVEVGDLRGEVRGAVPVRVGVGREGVAEGVRGGDVGDVGGRGRRRLAVHLHVLPQGARVRVGLVAAAHFAVVRLVAGVHVRVLLPVAAVGEFSVAALKLALERFLSLKEEEEEEMEEQLESGPCGRMPHVSMQGFHIFYAHHKIRIHFPAPVTQWTTASQHVLLK